MTVVLFRVRVTDLSKLPWLAGGHVAGGHVAGGWICAALPHRNWIEPFLLVGLMPTQPRLIAVADGPTIVRSWSRRLMLGLIGGVIPVWPDAHAAEFRTHLTAAAQAVSAGAVLSIFPEVGPPSRPPSLRRLSPGLAYFARHTGAVVVPVVFGGTHELYLRRRIEVRILSPLDPPTPTADRAAIAEWMADFRSLADAAATELDRAAEEAAPARKRWQWLTGHYPRVG